MKFSDVMGHEEEKKFLVRLVESDKIPHALLISGRSGIGKMKLARAFAKYIHCENRHDGDSCGVCPSCRRFDSMADPDVFYSYPILKKSPNKPAVSTDYAEQWIRMLADSPEMDYTRWQLLIGAENKQPVIYVDEANVIIYQANLSTMASKEKIFIMWLPEKMNVETANKLLKILEEPFPDTYFILVSNDASLILPTIYSRVQRLNLKPLSEDTIAEWLCSVKGMPLDKAKAMAPFAEGSLLKAAEIADGVGETEEFGEMYMRMMRAAYAVNMMELRDIAEATSGYGREKLQRFLSYVARMTRENFIFNLRFPKLNLMTEKETRFSSRFSAFVNERNVEQMSDETNRASEDVARNANSKIVMFDYLLQLAVLLKK